LETICWTDEAKFHNNGNVNSQNLRYWSNGNPHWHTEKNFQERYGINVWCGIFYDTLIGPFFFVDNLNGDKYLEFLKTELPILLEDIPLSRRKNLVWQQDGAPAHNKNTVIQYLNCTFGTNWMGTYSPKICWPPRSPDLTSPDYFLWGYLQSIVYKEMPANVNDLKQKIKDACLNIPSNVLVKTTTNELLRRLAICLEVDGHQFEHLLK